MKSFYIICGFVLFIGSFFLFNTAYDKYKVDKYGKIVKMRIEKLPTSCLGAKVQYFVLFSYNGELYDKSTIGDFCEKHYVGEYVDIKWLVGYKNILFPKESGLLEVVSCIILGLFGLFFIIYYWKK